ncbi:MAG: outer membrane protein assembly factor BamC [Deltaproteobacteria bacterium]|nr:outer membrane protein assembly factor BamC [Deltaproteobacteria bacterium]
MRRLCALTLIASLLVALGGCTVFHQPGSDVNPIHTRIYRTDYNTAWQAVLDALKSYDRAVVNREAGVIQTAWVDGNGHAGFVDPLAIEDASYKSKYRLSVSVAPGNYNGKPSVKISIQKEQLVQKDLLDTWQSVKTDAIEERTLLYRVGRVVYVKHKLKKMEQEKVRRALEEGV